MLDNFDLYIRSLSIDWGSIYENSYLRKIPSIASLDELVFHNAVTFFVGENGSGWVNANAPKNVVSGNGKYAVIGNNGTNTYKRLTTSALTYPTNIKVEYSEQYHQVRFTWDKVEGADRYGIAVYLADKWRVQAQNITGTTYISPKNLTPGKSYRVAIAARVNGKWDTANAIKHSGTVTIK